MSKISGFGSLGDPSGSFQIQGHALGGRDSAVSIQIPSANVKRESIDNLAKHLSANMRNINAAISKLEVLGEMIEVDKETDSVVLDKGFVDDFKECVIAIKEKFAEVMKAANK